MRYTTCIDISEYPLLYRNVNVRLVYFHLCLKSGYHDDDRDVYNLSLRRLSQEVGLTLSATRHALHVLSSAGIIYKQDSKTLVKKWTTQAKPTTRTKDNDPAAQQASMERRRAREAAELERQRKAADETARKLALWQQEIQQLVSRMAITELQTWLMELKDMKVKPHKGYRLRPDERNIAYLQQVIASRQNNQDSDEHLTPHQ